MSRLAVTTQVRHAGQAEYGGYLRILDLDQGAEVSTTPGPDAAYRGEDPNPRGGLRGAKGMSIKGRPLRGRERRPRLRVRSISVAARSQLLATAARVDPRPPRRGRRDLGHLGEQRPCRALQLGWKPGQLVELAVGSGHLVAALGFRSVPRVDTTLDFPPTGGDAGRCAQHRPPERHHAGTRRAAALVRSRPLAFCRSPPPRQGRRRPPRRARRLYETCADTTHAGSDEPPAGLVRGDRFADERGRAPRRGQGSGSFCSSSTAPASVRWFPVLRASRIRADN